MNARINIDNLKKYVDNHPLVQSVIVFLCIFSFFVVIYSLSGGDPIGGDHYFHFKYAHLLSTEGFDVVNNFRWLYLGGNGEYPVSLFQISLIPFTYLNDWLFALQMSDAFQASTAITLIYYTLKKAKVRYALFFALSLFASSYFLVRMTWGRAFVLPIALVFFEMYLAAEKKYKALFFTSILHVLWHQNTYFMPLIITGVVEAARYLVYQKMYIKNMISAISAVIIGMAFFPEFPGSLFDWVKNIFAIQVDASIDQNVKTIGGLELASKDFMSTFIGEKILLFLFLMAIVVVSFLYVQQKNRAKDLFEHVSKKNLLWIYGLFIFMIGMMFGTVTISGRFFDFLIPTIIVLIAFIVTALSGCKKIQIDSSLQKFLMSGIVIYVVMLASSTFINIYARANQFDYEPSKKAAQWIQENSKEGERVFLHNWSDFTLMFFTNHDNTYSAGIEPTALKNKSDELYWKYYNLFNYNYYCEELGDCEEELSQVKIFLRDKDEDFKKQVEKNNSKKIINSIKNEFGAKVIVSSSNSFTKTIELSPELISDKFHVKSKKYNGRSTEFTVFKLK